MIIRGELFVPIATAKVQLFREICKFLERKVEKEGKNSQIRVSTRARVKFIRQLRVRVRVRIRNGNPHSGERNVPTNSQIRECVCKWFYTSTVHHRRYMPLEKIVRKIKKGSVQNQYGFSSGSVQKDKDRQI